MKECEYVHTFCPHYEFYLDCETGCAAKAREIENHDADGETYPVMIGPVDEDTLAEIFRRLHMRNSVNRIYLPEIK